MKTFSLVTIRENEVAGLQPIVGGEERDAISFTFGVLTERITGRGAMFYQLGVEWLLEEGVRTPQEIDLPAGRQLGRWKLTGDEADPDLKWVSAQVEACEGGLN